MTTTTDLEGGLQAVAEKSQYLADASRQIADASQQVADVVVVEEAVRTSRHTMRWIVLGVIGLVVVLLLLRAKRRKARATDEA